MRLSVMDGSGVSAQLTRRIRVNAPPEVAFTVSPGEPLAGEQVTLVSTSEDAEGRLVEQAWDLDGDGDFDDASGASVSGMFTSAGRHSVALRVTDADGASSTRARAITVRAPDRPSTGTGAGPEVTPPAPFMKLMSPFPVVRLAGEVVRDGGPHADAQRACARRRTGRGPLPRRPLPGDRLHEAERAQAGPLPLARALPAGGHELSCSSGAATRSASTRASRSGAGGCPSAPTAASIPAQRQE